MDTDTDREARIEALAAKHLSNDADLRAQSGWDPLGAESTAKERAEEQVRGEDRELAAAREDAARLRRDRERGAEHEAAYSRHLTDDADLSAKMRQGPNERAEAQTEADRRADADVYERKE